MSLLAAKNGFPALAMAVYGTITDLSAFIGEGRAARPLAPRIWPSFPANEAEITEARSAIRWPEKIRVPVLIMHGETMATCRRSRRSGWPRLWPSVARLTS